MVKRPETYDNRPRAKTNWSETSLTSYQSRQCPVRGYRGGTGASTRVHHTNDENKHSHSLSLSNSRRSGMVDMNDENDSTEKWKDSSMLTTMAIDDEIDSAIRNLRSLTTNKKKTTKENSYSNSQKADLPQLNMMTDKTNSLNEQTKNEPSNPSFPKPNIIYVDSNDFILHNHVGKSINSFAD